MRKAAGWLLLGALLASILAGCALASKQAGAGEGVLAVLNPVGEPAVPLISPAPRLDSLDGKRIAVYVVRRANAFEFMDRVAENLAKQFPEAEILTHETDSIWAKLAYDRPSDYDKLLAEKPDAIVMGIST